MGGTLVGMGIVGGYVVQDGRAVRAHPGEVYPSELPECFRGHYPGLCLRNCCHREK